MKVKDLKNLLNEALETLEEHDEEEEVKIYTNTYWIKSSFFLSTHRGFIDLNNPTDTDDEDESEED